MSRSIFASLLRLKSHSPQPAGLLSIYFLFHCMLHEKSLCAPHIVYPHPPHLLFQTLLTSKHKRIGFTNQHMSGTYFAPEKANLFPFIYTERFWCGLILPLFESKTQNPCWQKFCFYFFWPTFTTCWVEGNSLSLPGTLFF